ncbi:MAG: hypothetical protein V4787_00255 [Pseudomonadota bacterium]
MTHDAVRRRHVFFLSGFDPKGAAYYHALYKSQSALQAGVTSGIAYEVGPRVRCPNGNSQWDITCTHADGTTFTTYEYSRWDDIVRSHWPRTGAQVVAATLRVYANALGWRRQLRKVWRRSPRTLISLAYPAIYWGAATALALLAAWCASRIAGSLGASGTVASSASGAAAFAACWWGAVAWERRINTTWLVRIYAFAIDWARGRLPEVPGRIDALAAVIEERLRDPEIDEVLLVGFSVGSMLAASAAARVQLAAHETNLRKFAVVTLGHCIPLLALIPQAHAYRAELARLGGGPHVPWIDYSSPTDWGSFALVEPISFSLDGDVRVVHPPSMASPRFHLMFPPERYKRLRADKRRMHMQYLMAGEIPARYDYFSMTAGPGSARGRAAAKEKDA